MGVSLSGDGNFTTTRGLGTVSIMMANPTANEATVEIVQSDTHSFVTYVDTLKTIYTYIHRMHDDITVDRMDVGVFFARGISRHIQRTFCYPNSDSQEQKT
jgi:hypothetical protein